MSECFCHALGGIECRKCIGRDAGGRASALPNAIELAKGWLDGAPVHQSWPMKIHVMVREARANKEQAT